MEKTILIEYADMKEEIKDLRRRIEKDRRELDRLSNMIVSDSVACGKKGKKPLRTVKIQGRPTQSMKRKSKALTTKLTLLEELEADLLERQTHVEEYIQGIKKSELRMMFRFYYIDDMTWHQVAMQMNNHFPKRTIKYTEDNCKQRHKRFFEKNM